MSAMWYESLKDPQRWSSLWHGWIRCGCGGIRRYTGHCAACDQDMAETREQVVQSRSGEIQRIPSASMGAESRYQDYVLLDMLATEWLRPTTAAEQFGGIAESSRPAAKAVVVLVFWTYFETKIERLLREPSRNIVPDRVLDDLLQRRSSIGARLDQTYKVLYGTTYFAELRALGYGDVADLLAEVHTARNRFVHGHPEAITSALTQQLVASLSKEHDGWIAAFNARLRARPKPLWSA